MGIALQATHNLIKPPGTRSTVVDQKTRSHEAQLNQSSILKNDNFADLLPYIVITSDIHLASSKGRFFPKTNQNFDAFLSFLSAQPPELLFINGDIVDNAVKSNSGRTIGGGLENWIKEKSIYNDFKAKYPEIAFLQSLGVGHDFGGAVPLINNLASEKGVYDWRGYQLIWFTIKRGVFLNEVEEHNNVLSESEYEWLDKQLRSSAAPILIFHVPIRTYETKIAGVWGESRNLTLDKRDKIYELIDKYSYKIAAIFNGHIHNIINTSYKDIPVYLCPFIDNGGFCVISKKEGGISIKPYRFKGSR